MVSPYLAAKIDEACEEYIKELDNMSKRKNKKTVVDQKPTESTIRTAMEAYRPSRFQLFVMKNFSNIVPKTYFREMLQWTAGVSGSLAFLSIILNLKESFITSAVMFGISGLILLAGKLYSNYTNNERIEQLNSILKLSVEEIVELEKKYYL